MAFLAQTIITAELLAAASVVSPTSLAHKKHLNFKQWASEYRTISIGLARQTGKTTTLLNLMDADTYLLVHSERMRDYVTKQLLTNAPNELRNRIVTVNGFVHAAMHHRIHTPISKLFTDEVCYIRNDATLALHNTLERLSTCNLLATDFYLLHVGTPRW